MTPIGIGDTLMLAMTTDASSQDHAIRLFLMSVCVTIGYFGILLPSGLMSPFQLHTQDQLFQWRHRRQATPASVNDIVLVKIDDRTLKATGRQWPWDRAVFAQLLNTVGTQHPKIIALDFAFVGASTTAADEALADAIRQQAPVLLAAYIDPLGNYVTPESRFLEAGGVTGLINKPRDRDLIVRRLWPAINLPGGAANPEFALEVKMAARMLAWMAL